jgi:hypothetical protein
MWRSRILPYVTLDCFADARNDGVDGLTQTASSAKAWSPKRHKEESRP